MRTDSGKWSVFQRFFTKFFSSIRSSRFGFTLVELLVVIAIIGVLIALLLPAVQAAREAARRMQCTNKLKQLGVATHNYHDVHQLFPAGAFYISGDTGNMRSFRAVWGVSILPFIEKNSLFADYNPAASLSNDDATAYPPGKNKEIGLTAVTDYICPSDLDAGKLATTGTGFAGWTSGDYQMPTTSYRGMAGRSSGGDWWWDSGGAGSRMGWRGIFHTVSATTWSYPAGYKYSLFQESFSSVLDGTSNTTIFSEHHRPDTGPERSTFWSNVPALHTITTSEHAGQMLVVTWERCRAASGQSSEDDKTRYCSRATGSYHTSGVNACLGDGSVKFVSQTINLAIWANYSAVDSGVSLSGL
ncbi:MAG: DUF1559 domain-containing protein [Planctomycetaceae bacterium]|nr:DUF1559 domain-containing protein [Planctomycetaceae bacterium]